MMRAKHLNGERKSVVIAAENEHIFFVSNK